MVELKQIAGDDQHVKQNMDIKDTHASSRVMIFSMTKPRYIDLKHLHK